MENPKVILNELKWKKEYNIENTEIWYTHRGAPNNTKIISGKEIKDIGKSFMQTNSGMIPYHRILKINYNKKNMFSR
jgi:uncharacterized protein